MEKLIDHAGTTFLVEEQGEQHKQTLVLIHGFPLDHSMWDEHLGPLAEHVHVIAPDLRGLGKSHSDHAKTTMEQHADDVIEILQKMKIPDPVIFCGLSMGGYVVWQIIQHHPEWVKGLILCDTKSQADNAEGKETRHELAQRVIAEGSVILPEIMLPKLIVEATKNSRPEVVKHLTTMMTTASALGVAACSRGMAERPDVTTHLPKIRVPTLVICGEYDAITPASQMQEMASQIPDAQFQVIPGVGHMSPNEAPEEFLKLVIPFVESLA
jgi:pimeloyl-ACP methyl ester carboxylesterase